MAVRPIDANAMLNELRPVSFEAEHSAVLLSDVSKMMREWVERQPTLTPPNEPLTQADLDAMDYDKVWIDYGDDGEWALVVSGRIYALAVLEGAGFEDILRDEVDGETMDRPSGNYTVYRCPPEGEEDA